MFGKLSKNKRLKNLEEDVDDLCYEMFCDLNHNNVLRRLSLLENFKGETVPAIVRSVNENVLIMDGNVKTIKSDIESLRDLQERLGQKVKDNDTGAKETVLALFKYLGLTLNEEGEVIKTKIKKNAKSNVVSTPKKTTKRKSK